MRRGETIFWLPSFSFFLGQYLLIRASGQPREGAPWFSPACYMPLITALDFLRRREASCVVLVLSRGMLAAGADAMSKWFGTAESPEDNEEMFKRFSIDQNEKYGEEASSPPHA